MYHFVQNLLCRFVIYNNLIVRIVLYKQHFQTYHIMNNIYFIVILIVSTTAYIELQLNRNPSLASKMNYAKS
jgi:hypothetical protein